MKSQNNQKCKYIRPIGRIVYLHRTQGLGAEGNHIIGLVRAFRRAGWHVTLVEPPSVNVEAHEPLHTGKGLEAGNRGFLSALAEYAPQIFFEVIELCYNAYAFFKLCFTLRLGRPDFIYERYALFSFAGLFISGLYGIPLFLEVNDSTEIARSRPLRMKRLARLIEAEVLKRAEAVFTVSNVFKKCLCRGHRLDSEKVYVTPNAVDIDRFNTQKIDCSLKSKLGLGDRKVIGVVGAFVPWHGLLFLVESMAPFMPNGKFHLLLVGDGPVRRDVIDCARNLGVENKVTITGFVPSYDVPAFIQAMDVCVMPGSNEHGSPVKIFEYMAMGKPVVAPNYGPISEVLTNGKEGLLFPPGDGQEMSRLILEILDDGKLRRRLGRCAQEKVLECYTWDNNTEKILAIYQNYISNLKNINPLKT